MLPNLAFMNWFGFVHISGLGDLLCFLAIGISGTVLTLFSISLFDKHDLAYKGDWDNMPVW